MVDGGEGLGKIKKIETIRISGRGGTEGMLSIEACERLERRGLERGGKTIKQSMVGGRERIWKRRGTNAQGLCHYGPVPICSVEKTNRNKSAAIKGEASQWGGKLVRCETGMPMRGRPVVNIL